MYFYSESVQTPKETLTRFCHYLTQTETVSKLNVAEFLISQVAGTMQISAIYKAIW